ncbi:glycosyl transferase, group 1 [Candidatus Koribacter versatilis Ellin345]|uniref:Glycosyl transferase, group 1 n=1 Tax=Koribacter versatilis (strain Ellin345) TaxID=204669 RepID=Q1IK09_KORVE|nr:glycosyltransferase family 4 protein [Candidatus Koribacter versatilis]ABF42791.1 glycosyl transferase, group 1 [Candidatus Koribacter versatilis Ellin345]
MAKNKQRNILIIVQNLPVPFDRRVWQEATSLQRAGFGVTVISPKKKIYKKTHEILEGVEVYRYPLIYEADAGVLGYFVEFVYCWLATLCFAVIAYARRPFHAIHACNPPDTYFALALLFRIFGVKFVFDHHDLCPEMFVAKGRSKQGILYKGLLFLERRTLRSADMVIAVNQSHFDISEQRGGIRPERIAIVRSGPRRAWADLDATKPELKNGRQHMVTYLGEMCKQDGVDILLESIAHYKSKYGESDTLFVFVGGGPDQQRLRNLATEMGLQGMTHFTGRVSDEDLWAYLSTSDVCVDPDPLTEWSNLSTMNKMIEYLAFGRPVVAFKLREHFNTAQDCALYVEPNDEKSMAESIRSLLLNSALRQEMSQKGRDRFRSDLAWENSEVVLVARYSELLGYQPSGYATAQLTTKKPLPDDQLQRAPEVP